MMRRPPPPAPRRQAPPPAQRRSASTAPAQQQSGGMLSGLMGTMAQGFAFGTGSSIARGAVGAAGDALFGGSASDQAAQPAAQQAAAAPAAQDSCAVDKRAFYQCLSLAVSASTNDRVFSSMAWKSTLISSQGNLERRRGQVLGALPRAEHVPGER